MIQAVIWDMDGVIVDSEPFHIQAETETFKKYGIAWNEEKASEFFGKRMRDLFETIVARYYLSQSWQEVFMTHKKTLQHFYQNLIPLTPHVKETLTKLKEQNYLLGLATSTLQELAEIVIEKHNLQSFFEACVFGDRVQHGKPDPEIFLKTAEKLLVQSRDCVVIEDSVNGFKAAQAASMFVIGYQSSHNRHQDFSLADYVIDDLRIIPEYVGSF